MYDTCQIYIFINHYTIYSAFTAKPERNCHFPAPGRSCMTHSQALQGFPEASQTYLHKNNINLLYSLARKTEVTDAFRFISEHTAVTILIKLQ